MLCETWNEHTRSQMDFRNLVVWYCRPHPGRGGQTEVTPDQTSFERTHVPGALELHGLEKASSALLSGRWSGTCLIRGHFVLGRSDQRSPLSGTV